MRVKAPVFNRHKSLRNVSWQVVEPDRGAAAVASVGDRDAVRVEDCDIGGSLWDRQLVNWRQLSRMPRQQADKAYAAPDAQHKAPVNEAPEERAPAAS
jgi:hypothetical protein